MIHIIDDWYMTADRYCYTVGRLRKNNRTNKDGEIVEEERFQNPSFHTTIGHALRSVLQESVQDKIAKGKVHDLAQLLSIMEDYNNKLIKEFDRAEALLHDHRKGRTRSPQPATRTK